MPENFNHLPRLHWSEARARLGPLSFPPVASAVSGVQNTANCSQEKAAFAVTPQGRIVPPSEYHPRQDILVFGKPAGAA
jgi:hypothetical protein